MTPARLLTCAISSTLLLSSCASTPVSTPAFNTSADAKSQAAAFIGNNGQQRYLADVNKVALTGCNVLFAETSSATSGTDGGLFANSGNYKRAETQVNVYYTLQGMSDEAMQRLANDVCTDAERRLAAAGFDVVPRAELLKNEAFKTLLASGKPSPYQFKIPSKKNNTTYKVFAADGFTVYDNRYLGTAGGLGQAFKAAGGNAAWQQEAKVMQELGVTAVSTSMLVDFAALEGDGGQKAFRLANKNTAEVSHGVNLGITGEVIFRPHSKMKCYKGWGDTQNCIPDHKIVPSFNSKNPVTISEKFYKDVVNATKTSDKVGGAATKGLAIMAAMGGLGGVTGYDITRYTVEVEPEQFAVSSRKGLDGFLDMVFVSAASR